MSSLAWFIFLPFILLDQFNLICVFIFIIVCLYKKIILINNFSKYNRVNILYFKIKYLNLYMFLDFLKFIFRYH